MDYYSDLKILKKKFQKIKKKMKKKMKKKIFISGAYGLLGTTLCRKLNEKNYKIFRHGTKRKRQYNFKLTNIKIYSDIYSKK